MKRWLPGISIALCVFIIQILSLRSVGMTWDEPSSFFFGRANLRFFTTGNRSYLNDFKNKELFRNEPFQYIYGEDVYPPFSFLISSATSLIFAEKLHLLSVIDAHHAGQIGIGILGMIAIYGIALSMGFSVLLSSGITLLYATYPTIIAQMRNDAKDVPLMSMLVIFVFFFLQWIQSTQKHLNSRHLYGILAAISLGLSEGTKSSALIIVPIIVGWFSLSIIFFPRFRRSLQPLLYRIIEGAMLSVLALGSFLFIWPWLWDDPVKKLSDAWQFFKVVGYGMPTLYMGTTYQAGINLPWHYPIGILIGQTPPSVLFFFLIGISYALVRIIKHRDYFACLPLVWFGLGIGRFFVPGVLIYAKIRHFIDAMPAFFLLVGYGIWGGAIFFMWGTKHISFIKKRLSSMNVQVSVIVLLIILIGHQLLIIMTHFPYEPSYFSFLVGGTKKVAAEGLFDAEYWASGVKEAMEYIDHTTVNPTTVYACTMAHLAVFYETPRVQVKKSPWEAEYILIPHSLSWFGGPLGFSKDHNTHLLTITRQGGPLFSVYKLSGGQYWNCGYETEMNYQF